MRRIVFQTEAARDAVTAPAGNIIFKVRRWLQRFLNSRPSSGASVLEQLLEPDRVGEGVAQRGVVEDHPSLLNPDSLPSRLLDNQYMPL